MGTRLAGEHGIVGRERELRRLRSLLRSARLLTLVGPGGAGKTTLALELCRSDRNVLVRLDSLGSDTELTAAVAAALEARTDRPLTEVIGERRVLLVLDGCERLVGACAALAESLLRRCPGLRVLATSRESLRVPGEVIFRVGGLSQPTPGRTRRGKGPARSEAVRLFVARARQVRPDFELSASTARPVVEICRRLEGLPLAIELAAELVDTGTPAEILAGIDDLVTPRLRATVDRSYRLLEPAERAVFRRLSVLAGGFDLDAARAVCVGAAVRPDAVVPLVCALEAKSMIIPAAPDAGRARFVLPHSVRAYGLARLSDAGEAQAVRERATAWLGERAEALSETLFFADAELWRLRQERDNLAAAVEYLGDLDPDRQILLTVALARVRWQQRHATAARRLLTAVLRPGRKSRYRSEALVWSALAAAMQSDHAEALRLANQAVRIERTQRRPIGLAKALDALAFVRTCRGEYAEAVAAYRECLELVGSLGRPLDTAKCQHCLAWTLLMVDEVTEAEGLLHEALPVYRALADPQSEVAVRNTVGALQLSKKDIDTAEATFVEVLRTASPGDYVGVHAVEGLAIVAAERGDAPRALCLAAAAATARRALEIGSPWRHRVDAAVAKARQALCPSRAAAALDSGRRLRGQRLASYALRTSTVDAAEPRGPLTGRELQVADLVAEGLTNQEIADRLWLSDRTVRTHLTSIHNKLDLRSRTQVAVWTTRRPTQLAGT